MNEGSDRAVRGPRRGWWRAFGRPRSARGRPRRKDTRTFKTTVTGLEALPSRPRIGPRTPFRRRLPRSSANKPAQPSPTTATQLKVMNPLLMQDDTAIGLPFPLTRLINPYGWIDL